MAKNKRLTPDYNVAADLIILAKNVFDDDNPKKAAKILLAAMESDGIEDIVDVFEKLNQQNVIASDDSDDDIADETDDENDDSDDDMDDESDDSDDESDDDSDEDDSDDEDEEAECSMTEKGKGIMAGAKKRSKKELIRITKAFLSSAAEDDDDDSEPKMSAKMRKARSDVSASERINRQATAMANKISLSGSKKHRALAKRHL